MADKPAMVGEPLPLLVTERYEAAKEYVTDHDFAVLAGHTWHKGKCSCGKPTCERPAKHPLTKNGVKDATKDIETVTHWWAQLRGLPNVAIATGAASGVDVIDFDVKSGGLDTLAVWKRERGELPRTPTVRTPTGGLHLFFRHVEGVGSKTGIAPGVDCRGDGGQVVAPPSVHANGEKYQWIEPLTTPLAEMPAWLLDMILKPKTQEKPKAEPQVVKTVNPMDRRLEDGVSLRQLAREPAFHHLGDWGVRQMMRRIRDSATAFARSHADEDMLRAITRLTQDASVADPHAGQKAEV